MADPSLYILHQDNTVVYLVVYVGDFLLLGPSLELIRGMKASLMSVCDSRDLGPVRQFIGTEVDHQPGRVS